MFWNDSIFRNSDNEKINCLVSVMDHLPYNIAICDNRGVLLYANESYLSLHKVFDIPLEDLERMTSFELVENGFIKRSGVVEVLKSGEAVTQIIVTKDNRHAYSYSAPIYNEEGRIVYVFNCSSFKEPMSHFIKEVEEKLLEERERSQGYREALNYLSMKQGYSEKHIVVGCKAMRRIYDKALMIANTECNVIIYGESGTGKDVLARFIHENSNNRRNYPFIPINCAAIPSDLIESEFFGYERGAFTGAKTTGKPGLFEIADKGTLFLNEIGELPLPLQAKLLSAVETRKITRLGGTVPKEINVHLIAATNRDLFDMVQQKSFREDLYYRLNVVTIYMPPLRERKEEIEALAVNFLSECNKSYSFQKVFSVQAIARCSSIIIR